MGGLIRVQNSNHLTSMSKSGKTPSKREYPNLYEKSVPVVIGILLIVIVIMIVFAIGVALGIIA